MQFGLSVEIHISRQKQTYFEYIIDHLMKI